MRHHWRIRENALYRTQADRNQRQLHPVQKPLGPLPGADVERDDRAVAGRLLLLHLAAGMLRQAGIIHGVDIAPAAQPIRQLAGADLAMRHPGAQRFHAAHQQPRILRAEDGAQTVLHVFQLTGQFLCPRDCQTGQHIAMPAEEFGRAVQDDIRPQLDRPLVIRRHERVVHDAEQSLLLRPGGDFRDIGNLQRRIGRRLHIHGFRIGFQR
ncbi:hypothetical protein D3C76_1140140 [compost metagenome]